LRNHGVSILASSILFQEHHTKENIWKEVEYMKNLRPDFAQFMQLGPLPQTELYKEYKKEGKLCSDIPYEEWHGQHRIWFKHPDFSGKESQKILRKAFEIDFLELGPSVMRMSDTLITGYKYTKKYTDPWKMKRCENLKEFCKKFYSAIDVMKAYLPNQKTKELAREVEEKYKEMFGEKSFQQQMLTKAGLGVAFVENLKLKLLGDVRQPSTYFTYYRKSLLQFLTAPLKGRTLPDMSFNFLELKLKENLTDGRLYLELHGIMDRINGRELYLKMVNYFKKENKSICLDMTKMTQIEDDSLERLVKKLKDFHSRILFYYSKKIAGADDIINQLKARYENISFVEYCHETCEKNLEF
ncbi:hypothetical protein HY745_08160, partial [Candidatus Desantisbacteria bacterium]|nr:hypothetical protein [Candidatus Desantisbacteria bacterium]